MEKILKDIYYNPKTGFKTNKRLYEEVKKVDNKIKLNDVLTFMKNQEEYQINKQANLNKKYQFKITAPIGYYQMDLAFFNKLGSENKNYKIMLSAIEIATRQGYIIPLKTKKDNDIAEAIKLLLKKVKNKIVAVTTDNGSEFLNNKVQAIFKSNNIMHYTAQVGDHNKMGMIERFNRTIKNYLRRYFTSNKTYKWIDVIDDFVYNYNNSFHSSIDAEPNYITKKQIDRARSDAIQYNALVRKFRDININDKVRVKLNRNKFEKEGEYWSKSIYTVVELIGNKYKLINNDTKNILQKYYSINDLQKIEDKPFENLIDIVDERKRSDKEK